ncbi:ABC transporter ATP-binding protein [Labrys monachus]|uniref:Energy-coupling factor transport system ATP-binding protein n=1 Tax=Labrys monachus TaxID=217067 RepID=A0ABU0FM46_9HYPH|nr:ABC transporter ATP-binding protein [Labrys monachus]MDQ0395678.1 energy-coupling factor transport system ATP-binding protein [Labrys monachus]
MALAVDPAVEAAPPRSLHPPADAPAIPAMQGGAAAAAMPGHEHAIEIRAVSYAYEGEANYVLDNVSLTVDEGEFVLILGPSGCGKSTLLQLLNGTIPHTLKGTLSGEVTVYGKPVATTKVATFATEVGMVFQDPEAQIINTRVRDEVCFGLENLCRPAAEILQRQAEALDFVGLDGFGDRSIFDLSGGQKQRVSIAAVLAARPRLLVLDEPTANLDPAGMAEIFAVLEKLNREAGTTIVMVEHRVDELADRVSRVVMMDRGTVVFDGTPREAFSQRRTAHSEEQGTVPTSAWFPQACEFALALSDAMGFPLAAADMPLNVGEAVQFAERHLGEGMPPALPAAVPAGEEVAPFLRVVDLRFGYERKLPILADISFDLGRGEMIALCGRNGSGKTTLARLLMHINPPPRGTILLEGKDIAGLTARDIAAEIGYVFQNPDHQFVTDRVWDEIAYGLQVRGYSEAAIKERVDEVLGIVDLQRYRDRSPFSLSLGERRRLSVATMLVLEPHLLVLDEPTIGQDHERAQQLMGLMARLRERYRTTILMITHDVRLVAEWADRALVISRGRLLFDGRPEAMFADSGLIQEAGLLVPPVFEISRALANLHPESAVRPTLSLADLAGTIAGPQRTPA